MNIQSRFDLFKIFIWRDTENVMIRNFKEKYSQPLQPKQWFDDCSNISSQNIEYLMTISLFVDNAFIFQLILLLGDIFKT